ncbi:HNH endonuclease [Actinomycetaceae bacterium WB03_NA08]|uniref:HNH endonuclease n=1 Tax=Scrofimicrobium canadense TaxID=2652290 RepID=A0A6N7VSQ9_9ACTO|nr:HNH endonuclease [Scrofimicrobium canadense]
MVSRRHLLASRRRARRVKAANNDLSAQQWRWLLAAWNHACAYCGGQYAELQKDCVHAISRGGRYTVENVVPACRSCNASKCNAEVTSWMRRKRLDEKRFLERWVMIIGSVRDSSDLEDATLALAAAMIEKR